MWLLVLLSGLSARDADAQTFVDPFDYCAAVGTIEVSDRLFDERFIGRPPIEQIRKVFRIGPGFDFLSDDSFVWRCFQGNVFGCWQSNKEICHRADISRVPTREMEDYCHVKGNRNSRDLPTFVMDTRHPSMYRWACRLGVATITEQLFTPDQRGYPPDLWRRLSR